MPQASLEDTNRNLWAHAEIVLMLFSSVLYSANGYLDLGESQKAQPPEMSATPLVLCAFAFGSHFVLYSV